MKTDVQILEDAIEILERDGVWCQDAFYKTDENGVRINYCAEGALLEAAGYYQSAAEFDGHANPVSAPDPRTDTWDIWRQAMDIADTIVRVNDLRYKFDIWSLNGFNDAPAVTREDVVLAMKNAIPKLKERQKGTER